MSALPVILPSVTDDAPNYRGIPILDLQVGDPIPVPRAPQRYAVRVTPGLARYFLTFNHPRNRSHKERKIRALASDMAAGRWQFTPRGPIFDRSGVLNDGQNTLLAVTVYGSAVWLMIDFGWPTDIITVIDRGSARTTPDALQIEGIGNTRVIASAYAKLWQYDRIVGTTRQLSGMDIPTSSDVVEGVEADPEAWLEAARFAGRMYEYLDKGGGKTLWAAMHRLISRERPDVASAFLDELRSGSGAAGSPTRALADWFRRRPATATRTGDEREPYEVIVRAFNAWDSERALAMPKFKGFVLSRVRGS